MDLFAKIEKILRKRGIEIRQAIDVTEILPLMLKITVQSKQKIRCVYDRDGPMMAADKLIDCIRQKPESFVAFLAALFRLQHLELYYKLYGDIRDDPKLIEELEAEQVRLNCQLEAKTENTSAGSESPDGQPPSYNTAVARQGPLGIDDSSSQTRSSWPLVQSGPNVGPIGDWSRGQGDQSRIHVLPLQGPPPPPVEQLIYSRAAAPQLSGGPPLAASGPAPMSLPAQAQIRPLVQVPTNQPLSYQQYHPPQPYPQFSQQPPQSAWQYLQQPHPSQVPVPPGQGQSTSQDLYQAGELGATGRQLQTLYMGERGTNLRTSNQSDSPEDNRRQAQLGQNQLDRATGSSNDKSLGEIDDRVMTSICQELSKVEEDNRPRWRKMIHDCELQISRKERKEIESMEDPADALIDWLEKCDCRLGQFADMLQKTGLSDALNILLTNYPDVSVNPGPMPEAVGGASRQYKEDLARMDESNLARAMDKSKSDYTDPLEDSSLIERDPERASRSHSEPKVLNIPPEDPESAECRPENTDVTTFATQAVSMIEPQKPPPMTTAVSMEPVSSEMEAFSTQVVEDPEGKKAVKNPEMEQQELQQDRVGQFSSADLEQTSFVDIQHGNPQDGFEVDQSAGNPQEGFEVDQSAQGLVTQSGPGDSAANQDSVTMTTDGSSLPQATLVPSMQHMNIRDTEDVGD